MEVQGHLNDVDMIVRWHMIKLELSRCGIQRQDTERLAEVLAQCAALAHLDVRNICHSARRWRWLNRYVLTAYIVVAVGLTLSHWAKEVWIHDMISWSLFDCIALGRHDPGESKVSVVVRVSQLCRVRARERSGRREEIKDVWRELHREETTRHVKHYTHRKVNRKKLFMGLWKDKWLLGGSENTRFEGPWHALKALHKCSRLLKPWAQTHTCT